MRILAKAVTCLPFLLGPAAAQTTWYVDATGSPPGTGTPQDPFVSIQFAIDQPSTVDGDTVLVAAGTYVENLRYRNKRLTLRGTAGPGECVIRAAVPGVVVWMNAPASFGLFCRLEGFSVTGGLDDRPAIRIAGGTEATLVSCVIADNAGAGLVVASSYDNLVLGCTFVRNGRQGVRMATGSILHVFQTVIWGNELEPVLSFGPHSSGSFAFCIIEDGFNGQPDVDPLYWEPANGDYRLRPGSPAIDAGDPNRPRDPDGSLADIGAFTYDPAYAPGPRAYCTSKVNSQGCTPSIGASGSASASGSPFFVTCVDVLNRKSGIVSYGFAPKATPYQGGWLCLVAPTRRTGVQDSGGNPPPDDCSGSYSYDFGARITAGVDPALVAGTMVYAQYWFRDPQQSGPFTMGRSDALAFGIRP